MPLVVGSWSQAVDPPNTSAPVPAPASPVPGPGMPGMAPSGPPAGMPGIQPPQAAEVQDAFPPDWKNKDVRELIEMARLAKLTREAGLNDEQTILLIRRYEEVKEQTAALGKERAEATANLRKVVESNASDEEAEKALEILRDVDRRFAEMRIGAIERFGEGLTPMQRAKMCLGMQDFRQDMMKMIDHARERRQSADGGNDKRQINPTTCSSDGPDKACSNSSG